MVTAAERLDAALRRAEGQGRQRAHEATWALIRSAYEPWKAQRLLHRSRARWRVLIAGRGAGKTHAAAKELLDLIGAAPPNSEAAVLAPTLTHAEAAQRALTELCAPIPGAEWRKSERRLLLPGGRSIKVFHGEHKHKTMKGPSLVALWVDEGALLAEEAFYAATPTLRSQAVETRLVVTTTPLGKNWCWKLFEEGGLPESAGVIERFRFRATESPYADHFTIERNRRLMAPEFFAQEYLAEFVDSLLLVFPDREGLYVDNPTVEPGPKARKWLGVDLGRKRDWTVCTLMDEHAQAQVLARWKEGQGAPVGDAYLKTQDQRIIDLAKHHGAMVVIDTGGAGGTVGARLAVDLRAAGVPVLEVATNRTGTKGQMVEHLKADVAWRRIRVIKGEHTDQLDHELGRFQGLQKVVHGQPITVYEGPQIEGEHDDCVISLTLANWGRVADETGPDTGDGGLASFRPRGPRPGGGGGAPHTPGRSGPSVGRRGYMFR